MSARSGDAGYGTVFVFVRSNHHPLRERADVPLSTLRPVVLGLVTFRGLLLRRLGIRKRALDAVDPVVKKEMHVKGQLARSIV